MGRTCGVILLTAARSISDACDEGRFISPEEFLLTQTPQTFADLASRFALATIRDVYIRQSRKHER